MKSAYFSCCYYIVNKISGPVLFIDLREANLLNQSDYVNIGEWKRFT